MNVYAEQDPESDDFPEEPDPIGMLEILSRSGNPIEIPIIPGKELRIGRDDLKCGWILRDDTVSKQHFRIYAIIYEKDKLHDFPPLIYCEDLESTNGTYVNGTCIGIIGRERIGHLLSDGDIIEIKPKHTFRFHQPVFQPEFRTKDQFNDIEYFKDRFEVSDRALGQGSYGAVYLAEEVGTSTQMACKIVDMDAAANKLADNLTIDPLGEDWYNRTRSVARAKQLVLREIKILSKLSHPHIVDLKKAFISNCSLYMVTELAAGGDLFSYIDFHGGFLSDWHSRVIARQVVLAIEYMHSNSIVHRDIKPENVLVMQTDFGGRVVLTDFGFANQINQQTGRLLSKVGTTGFIAPEVESMDVRTGGYTKAADLWSLGILTATLLTGSSMVPREELSQLSQVQIMQCFLGQDSAPRAPWQDVPPRALKFLRELLVLDPNKRLSATEALNHSWFKKPLSEAALLEQRYEQVIRFWRKRENDDVIEHLPGSYHASHEDQMVKVAPKLRRKIPDTTLSPYFGLDRHLLPKATSKRRTILDTLHESGSPFLVQEPHQHKARTTDPAPRSQDSVNVEIVNGGDLFGPLRSSSKAKTIPVESDPDEVDLDEIRLVQVLHRKISACGVNMAELAGEPELKFREHGVGVKKRKRTGSEDEEERRIRSGVAKELPRWSTAKALKVAVDKKKQAARDNRFGITVRSAVPTK